MALAHSRRFTVIHAGGHGYSRRFLGYFVFFWKFQIFLENPGNHQDACVFWHPNVRLRNCISGISIESQGGISRGGFRGEGKGSRSWGLSPAKSLEDDVYIFFFSFYFFIFCLEGECISFSCINTSFMLKHPGLCTNIFYALASSA